MNRRGNAKLARIRADICTLAGHHNPEEQLSRGHQLNEPYVFHCVVEGCSERPGSVQFPRSGGSALAIMVLKRPSSCARSLASEDSLSTVTHTKPHAQPKSRKLWLLCLIPALLLVVYASYRSPEASDVSYVTSSGLQLLSVEQSPEGPEGSPAKRVALCFFGLTRSLNHTLESIKENVIGKIEKEGYEVDVFLHTYNDVTHLTNGRTGEDDDLDTDQWHLLQPYDHILTSQDDFVEDIKCVYVSSSGLWLRGMKGKTWDAPTCSSASRRSAVDPATTVLACLRGRWCPHLPQRVGWLRWVSPLPCEHAACHWKSRHTFH